MDIFKRNRQAQLFASIFSTAALSYLAYLFYKKIFVPLKTKLLEAQATYLTKEEAFKRSSLIKNISYAVYLDLNNNFYYGNFVPN
jgi:uncharacterized membrane protein